MRGRERRAGGLPLAALAALAMLVASPTASADQGERASVRFLHAVPGAGQATLEAGGASTDRTAFAQVSDEVRVDAGRTKLVAEGAAGTEVETTVDLARGASYTVIAIPEDDRAEATPRLRVLRDGEARGGTVRARAIHASPELGSATLLVDGEPLVEDMGYGETSDYGSLQPGSHTFAVRNPRSGDRILSEKAEVSAGSSWTVAVVGSRGQPVDVVMVEEAGAAPRTAPDTGLGGLADENAPWVPALLAAAIAGILGAGAHLVARRRRSRPGG